VDAFIELCHRRSIHRLRLKIGGAATAADQKYINSIREKLDKAGLRDRYEIHANLSFNDKVRFFRDVTVFSVPCTSGEAFGLYVLEAIASGVPVVQPRHGAFPEIIETTKGGLLCEPDDVHSLADALSELLTDDVGRQRIADEGMNNVRKYYTAAAMAEGVETLLTEVLARSRPQPLAEVIP
jgi:glycosyltransferase involved in cell wall biosynthesis